MIHLGIRRVSEKPFQVNFHKISFDGKKFIYFVESLDLITPCFGDGVNPGTANYTSHAAYEILNPIDEATYTFMTDFLKEIVDTVSKDKYIHLGMDEVIELFSPTTRPSFNVSQFCDRFITLAGNRLPLSLNL